MQNLTILSLLLLAFVGNLDIALGFNKDLDKSPKRSLEVTDSEGAQIGKIEKALADKDGNILFAVLSIMDQNQNRKDIVVPITVLSREPDGKIVLDVDKSLLASAPEFDLAKFHSDPEYAEKVFKYYGQAPPWMEKEDSEGNEIGK